MSKCIGCGEQSLREAIPGEYFCLLCMGAAHRVRECIEQLNQMEREAFAMTEEDEMDEKEFANLETGDTVSHEGTKQGWQVQGNYGKLGVVMVRASLAHNPREWRVVNKAWEKGDE